MKQDGWHRSRLAGGRLGPGRLAVGGALLALAAVLAGALLITPRVLSIEPPGRSPVRSPTTAIMTQPVVPSTTPSVRPRLTADEVIALVAEQPVRRSPGRRLADVVDSQWTAEYRGDGTWIVRAGEPAWLVLEPDRAALPINTAAINLQEAGRATRPP